MKVYKILNTQTGEFHKGGGYSSWSKKGKVWLSIGALKLHLNHSRNKQELLNGKARIVEYELHESRAIPIQEVKPDWVIKDVIES